MVAPAFLLTVMNREKHMLLCRPTKATNNNNFMDQAQLFVQMALNAWEMQISRADKFFDAQTDEALLKPIAPGKNRVIYLLGHLIAVNDAMISLFAKGERAYAHMDEAFLKNPDNAGFAFPETILLRNDWKKSNAQLMEIFSQMTPEDWFSRHNAMTDEDFAQNPARNKMSVLLNRTGHVAYHLGQLVLAR